MHLAHADPLGNLGLGELLEEAELHDHALALGKRPAGNYQATIVALASSGPESTPVKLNFRIG